MKSDIDIKDDIYFHLKGSALEKAVDGRLCKRMRPNGSDGEDIVISVLANQNGQIQEATVNVNVYVRDVYVCGQYEEDGIRCRELCRIAWECLNVGRGGDYRFELDRQRVLPVEGKNEHFINNRLIYRQNNEID